MIKTLGQNLISGFPSKQRIIKEISVTDAPVTSIVIDGLDLINDGGEYTVVLKLVSNTDSDTGINIYVNGDTTPSNYGNRWIKLSGGGLTTGSGTGPWASTLGSPSGSTTFSVCNISMSNGLTYCESKDQCRSIANAYMLSFRHGVAQTNLTRLDVVSGTDNAIGVGSTISVYRI